MCFKKNVVKSILSQGAEIVGGTIAETAIGYIIRGPAGAVAGLVNGAIKHSIKRVSQTILVDIIDRTLSQREQIRVGTSMSLSIKKIDDYLSGGRQPRDDTFFSRQNKHRANSEEILEGVLLKCKKEHEERKIQYISNIFANVVFMNDISLGEANFRLSLAESMTYRQFCLLAIIRRSNENEFILRDDNYINGNKSPELRSILIEIYDLYQKGMVEDFHPDAGRTYSLSGILSIKPRNLRLTNHGMRQYIILSLDDIPSIECEQIVHSLR